MWDHLERIVGVGGVVGIGARGPGEQQIEIDRRIVQRRRTQLKRELAQIQKRKARQVRDRKSDHFMIGLVGYTNAGKSTLFNALTEGGAHADDRLFATLLTRTRQWDLGGGEMVMLSDTVGFVRDLPHNLIASFKATLEETTHADLLLIVLDVSDPSAELQYATVTQTLDEIFGETAEAERRAGREWTPPQRLLLLNKIDQLRDNSKLLVWLRREPEAIPICAADPSHQAGAEGIERLQERVRAAARGQMREALLTLPIADAKSINTIENRAEVLERRYNTDLVTLRVRIGDRQLAQLRSAGARMRVESAE